MNPSLCFVKIIIEGLCVLATFIAPSLNMPKFSVSITEGMDGIANILYLIQ